MRREWIVSLGLLALSACSAASSAKPCTTCPNVAGIYGESTTSVAETASTCGMIAWPGYTDQVQVTQDSTMLADGGTAFSSTITLLASEASWQFTGTLNADNSVTLGGISADDPMGDTGTLGLGGDFQVTGEKATGFEGDYNFLASTNACRVSAIPTLWTAQ